MTMFIPKPKAKKMAEYTRVRLDNLVFFRLRALQSLHAFIEHCFDCRFDYQRKDPLYEK